MLNGYNYTEGSVVGMYLNKLTALIALALSTSATAQVYELNFTDTNAKSVVKAPTATWFNPTDSVIVTAISGLDRKIKLELIKGTTVEQSQTSSLITLANRIVASDGSEFYGTKFTLTRPADGNYTLRSTVLDIKGVVVTTNSYTFNVDTVGPSTPNAFKFTMGAGTGGSIDVFGTDQAGNALTLDGLTDASSGIDGDKVTYFTIDAGGVRREKATAISSSYPATWNQKCKWAAASDVAPVQGFYTWGLVLADRAGNLSTFQRQSSMDNVIPPWSIEVWNSQTSQWVAFASAVSYENPVRFRMKVDKTKHVSFNGTSFGIATNPTSTDANFAYYEYTVLIPQGSAKYWRLTTKAGHFTDYNATSLSKVPLGGSAVPGPQEISFQYGLVGQPLTTGNTLRFAAPFTIDRLSVNVAARTYPQRAVVGSSNCTIPAGSTNCVLNPNIGQTAGRAYSLYTRKLENADTPSMYYQGTNFYVIHDFNAPTIDSFSFVPETRKLIMQVTDNDRTDNDRLSVWDTRTFKATALSSKGQSYTLTQTLYREETFKNKYVEFSTASLPDGLYTFTGQAIDTDGNVASQDLPATLIDGEAPVLTMTTVSGGAVTSIETLKDVRIGLTDNVDDEPMITSLTLKGGPINDNLQLGFSKVSDGYQPEVPRMFPSLEAGQEYTLKVDARDTQGNKASLSKVISLTPQNMVGSNPINMLSVAKSLLDKHDQPLGVVKFKGSLTDGGTQSRGLQAGFITLRRDSNFSVMFNGDLVAPGETKDIVIPLNEVGEAELPVWPANPGVNGKASFMLDIPQLTAN